MQDRIITIQRQLLWPVPQSDSKVIPSPGTPGCFWEDRGDRFHCGVDIYAPFGSDVLAADDGIVVGTELFTSPQKMDYWNETYAVTIQHACGLVIRYAEVCDLDDKNGTSIKRGDVISHIGQVLDPMRITKRSPLYIQKLKRNNNSTMLHVEVFDRYPFEIPAYLSGNTFQYFKPDFLLNPARFWDNH